MTYRGKRVREGERPSASEYNKLVEQIERLSMQSKGGNHSTLSISGGMFDADAKSEWMRFTLTEDLIKDSGTPANSVQVTKTEAGFESGLGIVKPIYSDFIQGDIVSGSLVVAFQRGGRWYAIGGTSTTTSSHCCAGCNPYNCIYPGVPISDCSAMTNGAEVWTITGISYFNSLCASIPNDVRMTQISGCQFQSEVFDCDGRESQWTLIVGDGASSTLILSIGASELITYRSVRKWCPTCENEMIICGPAPDRLTSHRLGRICVKPERTVHEPVVFGTVCGTPPFEIPADLFLTMDSLGSCPDGSYPQTVLLSANPPPERENCCRFWSGEFFPTLPANYNRISVSLVICRLGDDEFRAQLSFYALYFALPLSSSVEILHNDSIFVTSAEIDPLNLVFPNLDENYPGGAGENPIWKPCYDSSPPANPPGLPMSFSFHVTE